MASEKKESQGFFDRISRDLSFLLNLLEPSRVKIKKGGGDRMKKRIVLLIGLAGLAVALMSFFPGDGWALSSRSGWGRPDMPAVGPVNYQIWQDSDGWHIRWSSAWKIRHFRGRIYSPYGEVVLIRRVDRERGDIIRRDGGSIVFSAHTKRGSDGFDFVVSGRSLVFDLTIDGHYLPQRVFVGRHAVNPSQVPFSIAQAPVHRGYSRSPRPHDRVVSMPGYRGFLEFLIFALH